MKNSTENTVAIGIGITLATALLYTAGWSHAGHWFGRFHIGLIPLGLPMEYHFMYGLQVLLDHGWWLSMIFASALLLWYSRPPTLLWARWLMLPLGVMLFALVYRLGEMSAEQAFAEHRAAGFPEYPLTRVWLTEAPGDDPALADLAKGLVAGEYRLLAESQTSLFLIKPKPGGEMPTVEVPLRRVVAVRRIPVNPGLMGSSKGKE
uniref:Uncharacterized protein n=1 Tax=Candidatus Kentrum sp. TC TaxID=2126339 RepID=A0A450YDV9_9GAMM|nr:MAG: hypothetical protein BECKTC1821D_GA0114238_100432 [Candidatus Kentron sp. TC]VFK39742.1 MAG: hypothetical protein BECKTC1821E_GA0114239_100534 [Candidatus Kentron sp. TC]VFK54251.1 MAG: hypothetical protein BECKTC1821F_GA0114240_100490 [Candidatus Kentron sp. TC]